jgi:hypothetical protein
MSADGIIKLVHVTFTKITRNLTAHKQSELIGSYSVCCRILIPSIIQSVSSITMWELDTETPSVYGECQINRKINVNIQTDVRPYTDAFQAHKCKLYIG